MGFISFNLVKKLFIAFFFRNTRSRGPFPTIVLEGTMVVMTVILIACHIIIFIVVVQQHVKIRILVNAEPSSAPNPIFLALKSSKKIMAVTICHIVQFVVTFTGVYLSGDNENGRFFCIWLGYSQTIWNCCFYTHFPQTQGVKSKDFFVERKYKYTSCNQQAKNK